MSEASTDVLDVCDVRAFLFELSYIQSEKRVTL